MTEEKKNMFENSELSQEIKRLTEQREECSKNLQDAKSDFEKEMLAQDIEKFNIRIEAIKKIMQ